MKASSRMHHAPALRGALLAECHAQFAAYMDISADEYAQSLAHKTWIFLHREAEGGRLIGQVSARLSLETHPLDGRAVAIFSTHHAAIDPAWRGAGLLQRSIFWFCLAARRRHPWLRMLLSFDAMGYGSYLHLAHGLAECWPRHDAPMPAHWFVLLDRILSRDYPEAWVRERGVLRWPSRRLRAGAADITPQMMDSDPHLRFFAHANPHHAEGESLVCVAPVSWRNFRHAVWHRMMRPALARPRHARA
jgi:hypothetical protein